MDPSDPFPHKREGRLAFANETGTVALIADEFSESVALMAEYTNSEAFHPPRPPYEGPWPTSLKTDDDVARVLERQGRLVCADAPELTVAYVDREVQAMRTTGGAKFPGGRAAITALSMDLLLASATGAPVVCEVKLREDKEPVSALLQGLAEAAQVVSPAQRLRLQRHYGLQADGRVGLCLLLTEFAHAATHMAGLLEAAGLLAAGLMAQPQVNAHLERISCLLVELEPHPGASHLTQLTARRAWSHEAA